MLISCLMLTYGRYRSDEDNDWQIVCEAVESFLRQTHMRKELVIINDQPEQTIEFDHPQVRIFNLKERFKTLGEKRNYAVQRASGPICAIWDDDDISLPNRLSNIAYHYEQYPDVEYAAELDYYVSVNNQNMKLEHGGGAGIFASASFNRDTVLDVPYQARSDGEDTNLVSDLHAAGRKIMPYRNTPCFIYRWGMNLTHISMHGDGNKTYGMIGDKQFVEKTVQINPYWMLEYDKIQPI